MITDFFVLTLMIAAIFYWLDAIRSKELAREAGKNVCKKYELIFLDDTVVIKKLRLRRDLHGRIKFYREYQFEFSSDEAYRYSGIICMLGKFIQNINMDAYHLEA